MLVGKHGDHVGGELDAFECLQSGEAAACAMLDLNWDGWTRDGTIDAERFAVVAETDRFDHCVFTVRQDFDAGRGAALARRAVRDALRQPRAPRDDGSRRAEGVAARPDDRLRAAGRRRRVGAFLRASRAVVSALPLFPGDDRRELAAAAAGRRRAAAGFAAGASTAPSSTGSLDAAVVELLRLQEALGCDIVTDGELRRDNFYSFVAEKLAGVRLMTLAEMLDVVEDKAGFERLLQTLDVPAYSISSPICAGKIERRAAAGRRRSAVRAASHRSAGQGHAARAVPAHAGDVRLRADRARSIRRRRSSRRTSWRCCGPSSTELAAEGADFVQLDEPVLTELAFAPGQHAHVHVRGAGGAKGSRRGARVRRVADQPGGRRRVGTCGSACTSAAATGAATKRRC